MAESKVNKEDVKAAQSLRAEKERILAIEKQIADLRKSLSGYSNEELQNNRQAISLTESIGKLYEAREQSIEKIRKGREQLRNLDNDEIKNSTLRERYIQNQIRSGERLISQAQERRSLSIEEFNTLNDIADSYAEIEDKAETLLNNTKLRQDQQESLNASIALAKGLQDKISEAIKNGTENSKEFARAGEMGMTAVNGIVEMEETLQAAQEAALKGEFQKINLRRQESRLRELNFMIEENTLGLSEDQLEELMSVRDALSSSIDKARELNGAYEEISESVKKTQEAGKLGGELLGKAFDSVKSTISNIPGGDMLLKAFKFDDIQSKIQEKVGGSFTNFFEKFKGQSDTAMGEMEGGIEGVAGEIGGLTSGGAAGMQSLGGAASGAMNAASMGANMFGASLAAATAGITLIIAGVMKLVEMFNAADKEVSQMGKDLGIPKKEAIGVYNAAADAANEMGLVGIHAEHIGKGLQTVSENLGGIDLSKQFAAGNKHVQQMAKDAAVLTEKFGMSGEEVAGMQSNATLLGMSVGQASAFSATMGKGIMTAKQSMKLLAEIPPSIVSSMKKMPEAMIKTAQHAKMLGMNMKQIADIGRKSLDIESSLEAQFEAQALTGKAINLDKMRAAALAGDQETVMKELLAQTGSLAEFEKMNVIQKEAMAKAMGMEVDQMAEMLAKQEELNLLGLDQKGMEELHKKNAEEVLAMKRSGNSEDDKAYNAALEKIAAENESASLQENMESMMKRIQQLAVKIVTPILDMVDGFMGGKEAAGGLTDTLGVVFDILGGILSVAITPIKAAFNVISELLGPIFDSLNGIGGETEGISKYLEYVKNVWDAIFGLLGPIAKFIGDNIGSTIGLIVNQVKSVFSIFEGIGKILTGDLQGGLEQIGAGIKDFFMGPIEFVQGLFENFVGLFEGIGAKIKNVVKSLLPNWALKLLGLGGEEPEAAAAETKEAGTPDATAKVAEGGEVAQAAEGGKIDSGGIVLVGEKGPELVQLPTGATVSSTGAGDQAGGILKALGLGGGGGGEATKEGEEGAGPMDQILMYLQAITDFFSSVAAPGFEAMASAGEVLKGLGEFFGVGEKKEGEGGEGEEKSPLEQLVEYAQQSATALTEFVYGKTNEDGEKEKGPLEQLVEHAQKTAEALTEFVYGKEVENEDGTKEKQASLFEQLLDEAIRTTDAVEKLVSITEAVYGVKAVEKEVPKETSSFIDALMNPFMGGEQVETDAEGGERTQVDNKNQIEVERDFSAMPMSPGFGFGLPPLVEPQSNANGGMEQKLGEAVALLSQIVSAMAGPAVIKFGDKTVEEISGLLKLKNSYQVKVDNTYGRIV